MINVMCGLLKYKNKHINKPQNKKKKKKKRVIILLIKKNVYQSRTVFTLKIPHYNK